MTRRKGLIKILFIALAVLLLAVFFAGCGEYKPPENTGGKPVTPVEPKPPVNPTDPDENYFTVTLTHYDGSPFTSADYSEITELQAQWTEVVDGNNRAQVYRAPFDKNGVAKIAFVNSEFKVTLVTTEAFSKTYTYDPNPARPERRDELVTYRDKQDVTVPMYALKSFGDKRYMNMGGKPAPYYLLSQTGAYSCTLTSEEDKQMFMYLPQLSGEYSFMTLIDVTADEINPIVDLHNGTSQYISDYPAVIQDDGGAEGGYTKNVWLKYQLTPDEVGNVMIFNLHSESEKPDTYPLTVNFIFERDGEFTKRDDYPDATPVSVTEDFSKTPNTPGGTFRFLGAVVPDGGGMKTNTRHILDERNVKYYNPADGGDGYYYFINSATGDFYRNEDGTVNPQYRLYAALRRRNEVHDEFTNPDLAKMLHYVSEKAGKPAYNYAAFVTAYTGHCNGNGVYPVNAELKTFLQRWAVSQRYFNDGNGIAEWPAPEGPGYNSDEDSQWMYACGLYS